MGSINGWMGGQMDGWMDEWHVKVSMSSWRYYYTTTPNTSNHVTVSTGKLPVHFLVEII